LGDDWFGFWEGLAAVGLDQRDVGIAFLERIKRSELGSFWKRDLRGLELRNFWGLKVEIRNLGDFWDLKIPYCGLGGTRTDSEHKETRE